MKKKRNSIMVLGTGPVIVMAVLLVFLLVFLIFMAVELRQREPALSIGCVFFAIVAGGVAVLLVSACIHHRKEDRLLEERWEKLDEDLTLADPEPDREGSSENEGIGISELVR